jgi:hypothetical protein
LTEIWYAQKYAHLFENFFLESVSCFPIPPPRIQHSLRASIFPVWGNGKLELRFAAENIDEDKWIQFGDEWIRRKENDSERVARKKRDWNMFYRRHSSRIEEKGKKEKPTPTLRQSLEADSPPSDSMMMSADLPSASSEMVQMKKVARAWNLSRKNRKEKEISETSALSVDNELEGTDAAYQGGVTGEDDLSSSKPAAADSSFPQKVHIRSLVSIL